MDPGVTGERGVAPSRPMGAIAMSTSRTKWSAILLNVLVPGSGLVILRREWLGLCLALLYGLLAQTALWGVWLIPISIPRLVVVGSAISAAAVWAGPSGC